MATHVFEASLFLLTRGCAKGCHHMTQDMDYYNNSRGRTIGSSAGSDAAAETGCKSAALSGSLHTCCGF